MANILRGVGKITNSAGQTFEWDLKSTPPTAGQGLIYEGGVWVPKNVGASIGTKSNPATGAKQITDQGLDNGWYWVDFGLSSPNLVYVNTKYDGGGWYLVIQNIKGTGGMPNLSWANATADRQHYRSGGSIHPAVEGPEGETYVNNDNPPGGFNLWTGMELWKKMTLDSNSSVTKRQVAQIVYSSPTTLDGSYTKRATWDYTGFGANYAWQGATNCQTSSEEPGMYATHAVNGCKLTTTDRDNDTSGSNCSNNYGGHPWWYSNCWSGSNWGSTAGNYEDAYYWHGSGTDYHQYGATYVRPIL